MRTGKRSSASRINTTSPARYYNGRIEREEPQLQTHLRHRVQRTRDRKWKAYTFTMLERRPRKRDTRKLGLGRLALARFCGVDPRIRSARAALSGCQKKEAAGDSARELEENWPRETESQTAYGAAVEKNTASRKRKVFQDQVSGVVTFAVLRGQYVYPRCGWNLIPTFQTRTRPTCTT